MLLKYVCGWSGGKDSTASIILAHIYNEPLDVILFAEVMFDKENNISGEHPKYIDFMKRVAKPLFESWGYEVVFVKSDRDYLDCFNRIITRPTKHPDHKGKRFGFPILGCCNIQRDLKLKPISNYKKSLNDTVIDYVGIAADEPVRLKRLHKKPNQISLLEKYGYTEDMAMALCACYGLVSPAYELSSRGGCWFCCNARILEFQNIKDTMPDVWNRFVSLEQEENLAFDKFHPFGKKLCEIDKLLT